MGKKKRKSVTRAEVVSATKQRRGKKRERRAKIRAESSECVGHYSTVAAPYSLEEYMKKAEEYLDCFQVDMAVKFCEHALQLEPTNLHVLDTMAPLLLETGETDRALELFQQAVTLSPDIGHTKYLYLGELTEGEEAIGYLTKGIELLEGVVQVGGACEGGDSQKELSTAYCSLAEIYLTDLCFADDAGQRCYECCCRAIKWSPDNPEAHQLMASCLLSQQLPEKAEEALMKGVSLWLPSCREKGEEQEEKEPVAMAKEKSVSIPPYQSRVGVAKLLLELEMYELAFEVLEGLLQEEDEVVGVWYLMGWLHYLTKDADSARFYLEEMQILYGKLKCDEEDLLAHAKELLEELGPTSPGEATEEVVVEEEEEVEKEVKENKEGITKQRKESSTEDEMDTSA